MIHIVMKPLTLILVLAGYMTAKSMTTPSGLVQRAIVAIREWIREHVPGFGLPGARPGIRATGQSGSP